MRCRFTKPTPGNGAAICDATWKWPANTRHESPQPVSEALAEAAAVGRPGTNRIGDPSSHRLIHDCHKIACVKLKFLLNSNNRFYYLVLEARLASCSVASNNVRTCWRFSGSQSS